MLERLYTAPIFLVALTVHELAHALAADKLGDPTARVAGRITLNPLKHLDPYGALLFLVTGFGWAKPVPFDLYNLAHPRRDSALIALAGPASNIALAVATSLVIRFFPAPFIVSYFLYSLVYINIMLAVFNFVPVSPLDGEKILVGLLPRDMAYEYEAVMNRYGTMILIFLILPLFNSISPIQSLVGPVQNFLVNLILPQ